MKALTPENDGLVIVRDKVKGRCVIANRDFKKGELITVNHVITYPFLPEGSRLLIWSMWWTNKEDCLALGYINLLNHSEKYPNVCITNDYRNKMKRLYADRDIVKGEELLISYACELDFKPVKE